MVTRIESLVSRKKFVYLFLQNFTLSPLSLIFLSNFVVNKKLPDLKIQLQGNVLKKIICLSERQFYALKMSILVCIDVYRVFYENSKTLFNSKKYRVDVCSAVILSVFFLYLLNLDEITIISTPFDVKVVHKIKRCRKILTED